MIDKLSIMYTKQGITHRLTTRTDDSFINDNLANLFHNIIRESEADYQSVLDKMNEMQDYE